MSEKVKPATDEQLKIWQARPCGDTQCRCTELHLDQAIARIEADRAIKADLVKAAEYVLEHSLLYRVAGWEKLQAALDAAKAEAK